jgi:hypothetical protein
MTPTIWFRLDPTLRSLGFLPDIVMAEDKRPVKEQLEDRYAHGGGFRPIKGFKLNPKTLVLRFPGDDPFKPGATAKINDETVVFYPYCSLLMILQRDGKFEVTRVD